MASFTHVSLAHIKTLAHESSLALAIAVLAFWHTTMESQLAPRRRGSLRQSFVARRRLRSAHGSSCSLRRRERSLLHPCRLDRCGLLCRLQMQHRLGCSDTASEEGKHVMDDGQVDEAARASYASVEKAPRQGVDRSYIRHRHACPYHPLRAPTRGGSRRSTTSALIVHRIHPRRIHQHLASLPLTNPTSPTQLSAAPRASPPQKSPSPPPL